MRDFEIEILVTPIDGMTKEHLQSYTARMQIGGELFEKRPEIANEILLRSFRQTLDKMIDKKIL